MTDKENKALGARVAARRVKLGLSQKTLAEAVGMKQQGIANIESGLVGRPRRLPELAEALQTTIEWLLKGKGQEISRTPNAVEEIAILVQSVHNKERLGVVIGLLRRLTESDTEAA